MRTFDYRKQVFHMTRIFLKNVIKIRVQFNGSMSNIIEDKLNYTHRFFPPFVTHLLTIIIQYPGEIQFVNNVPFRNQTLSVSSLALKRSKKVEFLLRFAFDVNLPNYLYVHEIENVLRLCQKSNGSYQKAYLGKYFLIL